MQREISVFILLNLASYLAAIKVSEGNPDIGLFWKILAKSFYVYNWALVLVARIADLDHTNLRLITGIILNGILNGLIVERIFALRRIPSLRTKRLHWVCHCRFYCLETNRNTGYNDHY
jgi:hypothetical protein